MRARRGASLVVLAIGFGAASARADAAAFYLQEQSTKAIGRAFSGEVSERGAQQQWWNPAAIGGITGIQSYAGITGIVPTADSSDRGTTVGYPNLAGGVDLVAAGGLPNQHDPIHNGYLPNGGFAVAITPKLAFGLTMTSPFSFTTNYKDASWARYAADKTRLRTFDFQPSLAFAPNEHISIGAGPNIEYVRATLSNFLPDPLSIGNPDGHQFLKGDGWDVGYSFGFQYHDDKVDIGASYKSSVKHTLKGHLTIDGIDPTVDPLAGIINQRVDGAEAHFATPWQVNVGMRYHLTPALTIEGQIARFGWERFDQIALSGLPALLGAQVIPENYHNTFAYSVGFDYRVSPKLTVRGGVLRDLSPVDPAGRDPRVPDGPRWNVATGGSYEITRFMGLDAAFSYTKIHSETINNTVQEYANTPVERTVYTQGLLHNAHALVFSLGGHLNF